MRKNGFTLVGCLAVALIFLLPAVLFYVIWQSSVDIKEPNEPDYSAVSQNYEFPLAKEFEKSPLYSISWVEEGILLVKAKRRFNERYGCVPYLAQAIKEVEEKYIITARTPVRMVPSEYSATITDGLLLEVEPK